MKPIYRCELCKKWFCMHHLKPKFPYIVDWEAIFDVEGDPRIKAAFHAEYKREGGHPDFILLRKTIEKIEREEKTQNQAIKQAMDRMNEADRQERIEQSEKEAKEKAIQKAEEEKLRAIGKATTTENKYGIRFMVPLEVYSNAEYREYLNYAQTTKSVDAIVEEYYKKYGKGKREKTSKKKHWWQH
ncbi:MAG: hypothetical protein NWF04_00880 [Candidatus Bathyarchaeota archaeon]|nr:hypothetical protein [Candidatus Bathyarchaeota archaeon]